MKNKLKKAGKVIAGTTVTMGVAIALAALVLSPGPDTCQASDQMLDNKAREAYQLMKDQGNQSREVIEREIGAVDNKCTDYSIKRLKEDYPVVSRNYGKAGEFLVLEEELDG